MTDPNKGENAEADKVAALSSQIENLNKGIANYRKEIDELKKNPATDTEDELELTAKDKKRLETWAKENGLVTKEEVEEDRRKSNQEKLKTIETDAITGFLKKYPQYDKDEEWKKVLAEFSLYKQPTTISGYKQLLERIHKDVGDVKTEGDTKTKVKVEDQKRNLLSVSTGTGASPASEETDTDTLEKLKAKYPNLSEDQIKSRLNEIKTLYPKKDKD